MTLQHKKNILFICYYFPPMGMGGTQRAAKYVKYLPNFGWLPIVVTVKDVHYYAYDNTLLTEIENTPIYRTESLDPLRLLARFKKHKGTSLKNSPTRSSKTILNILNERIGGLLFVPDSKILWLPFAIVTSIRLIRQQRIKIIFTTSPPHSAHLAGVILKTLTPVKWVADFRDDWSAGESQPCPTIFHSIINRFLEKIVLKMSDHVIGMCDHLTDILQKKSVSSGRKFTTIMNGYDRDDFKPVIHTPLNKKFTITHCGSISRVSNPEPFLKAIRLLFDENNELQQNLSVQFIGTDIYGNLQQLLKKYRLTEIIKPIQYLKHHEAIKKIMSSHLLLLTIFKKSNEEIITGKVFEYLASGKPILVVSSNGYVAKLVQYLQRGTVIDNNNINGIKKVVLSYFKLYQTGRLHFYQPLSLSQFDRGNLTGELASVLRKIE